MERTPVGRLHWQFGALGPAALTASVGAMFDPCSCLGSALILSVVLALFLWYPPKKTRLEFVVFIRPVVLTPEGTATDR